jgi:predicted kinase
MELVVLVGLPGAGKTTFHQRYFAATHVLVSKDLLRSQRRPADRQLVLVRAALTQGRPVVVDNTNPTVADRAPLIAEARVLGARVVGYFFPPDLPGCRQRNAARAGRARVPDVALFIIARKLEPPSFEEGFDALHQVQLAGGGFTVTARER